MTALTVSPEDYIFSGISVSQDSMSQAPTSVRMLNGDNLGQPFRDLSAAAAYRKAELMATCANYGIIWPFMPGNQMLAGLPVTVHNPLVTSLDTKLHHQIARVQQYFSARGHRRGNALSLDRLGDRAYEDGNCDIFQQQAASLLQVLKDLDLLKVACAIAANNYVFIIDHVSTHIPRETLTAIVENLEYNAKLLNNSITPFTMVQHEYSRCTSCTSVTAFTTMQLVQLTAAFLKGISGFLQPATLQTITGSVTSGLYRNIDPTLLEILRLLFMYEDSNERVSLRRKYIKAELNKPIHTLSVHQALQEWTDRKQVHNDVFHQPAYH